MDLWSGSIGYLGYPAHPAETQAREVSSCDCILEAVVLGPMKQCAIPVLIHGERHAILPRHELPDWFFTEWGGYVREGQRLLVRIVSIRPDGVALVSMRPTA
jgi:hypothetical protein